LKCDHTFRYGTLGAECIARLVTSATEGPCGARGGAEPGGRYPPGTREGGNAERVPVAGRQAETEAAPIRYVAELVGTDTDSEWVIRWLIALMVLCCDSLAIALTAAVSVRRTTV
jgi:hypothetical protein